jgi:hypothetical protein
MRESLPCSFINYPDVKVCSFQVGILFVSNFIALSSLLLRHFRKIKTVTPPQKGNWREVRILSSVQ